MQERNSITTEKRYKGAKGFSRCPRNFWSVACTNSYPSLELKIEGANGFSYRYIYIYPRLWKLRDTEILVDKGGTYRLKSKF